MQKRPIVHVALVILFASALIGGCESATQTADDEQAPAPLERLIDDLERYRQGVLRTPQTDQTIIERIDEIVAALQKEGPGTIERNPRLMIAILSQDQYVAGADRLRLTGIVPTSSDIQRIEILNANGEVVARAITASGGWGYRSPELDIAERVVLLYTKPSRFDPPGLEPFPGVAEGMIIDTDPFPHPSIVGDRWEVVQLPSDWDQQQLSARLVFGDGRQTNTVKIWIYGDDLTR